MAEPVTITLTVVAVATAVTALFRYLPAVICAWRAERKDLPKLVKEMYGAKRSDAVPQRRLGSTSAQSPPSPGKPDRGT